LSIHLFSPKVQGGKAPLLYSSANITRKEQNRHKPKILSALAIAFLVIVFTNTPS